MEKQIDVACHIIRLKLHMDLRLKALGDLRRNFFTETGAAGASLILSPAGRLNCPSRVATPRASSSTLRSPASSRHGEHPGGRYPRGDTRGAVQDQGARPFRPDDPRSARSIPHASR